jgi:endoglucanase
MQPQKTMLAVQLGLLMTLGLPMGLKAEGFLHTRGQDMVDESGHKTLLRGVGLGNWLLPEGYMWKFGDKGDRPRKIEQLVTDLIGEENASRFWIAYRQNYVTEADIERIAALGFNSVRPALNARRFLTEGENPAYVDEGFELLDHLVQWCKKHQIYVIIDMHGAPGGQTGANIDDSPNDLPELFTDEKNQERLIELWVKIATRYKDEPTVAAYDLLNEPLPERTGAAAKYKDYLEPLYQRVTAAIRQVDKKHMITLEGADWANDWSVFTKPYDANLFYQFHYYCWDRPDKLNSIAKFLSRRGELNAPVWVGETGEKDNLIYWATTQYFEANNIGWSFWPWKKMDANNGLYSINRPEGWNEIVAYSRGRSKPSTAVAQKAFDQLLENIKIEHCVAFPEVANALFHRVPGRVEAENYGHEGQNKSYVVKDPTVMAKFYRTAEPVPIELNGNDNGRSGAGQSIRLQAEEWTAYQVDSQTARGCDVVIRAKAESVPAAFTLLMNEQAETVTVSENGWMQLKLKPMKMTLGLNRCQLIVKDGTIRFDWLSFE